MSDFEFTSNKAAILRSAKASIDRALEILGGTAEGYAKQLCPVDTGNLRNSIAHERSTSEENTMLVGSNVHYAPFVELGTVKMTARPYLRPAIENHTSEYKKIVEQELKL